MHHPLLPATLLAVLTLTSLTACSNDSRSLLEPSLPQPAGDQPGPGAGATGAVDSTIVAVDSAVVADSSGGAADSGGVDSAITGGTWTPSGTDTIQPVSSADYLPAGTGTGAPNGTSTTLVFQTSGRARYGVGTCGPNGTWTSTDGSVTIPNSPNCLAYFSDGRTGNNGKGKCVQSPEGYAGLWLNAHMRATSPYHANCVQIGATTTSLVLSFPGQAELYDARDGSAGRILNFVANGAVQAQLIYQGDANPTSTGAGMLIGTDGADQLWTIDFAQPALNYTGGEANGDLVTSLIESGLQVIACNTALGCSLINFQVTLTP